MAKRKNFKNSKYKRDARLAVTPTISGAKREPKKAAILDKVDTNLDSVANIVGRKSYGQKAREQGLYINICAGIRKFRQENRDSTFAELAIFLKDNYPTIFDNDNIIKYPQNLSKVIAGDRGWSSAYFSSGLTLIELAEQRMYEVLEDEDIDNKDKITAYDKVMRYDLARRELEKENSSDVEQMDMNVTLNFGDMSGDDDICTLK